MAAGLPNADPAPGTPPRGDLANERHCVNPDTGNNVACPSAWTPGAVMVFIPGGGNNQTCLNSQGQNCNGSQSQNCVGAQNDSCNGNNPQICKGYVPQSCGSIGPQTCKTRAH